MIKLSEEIKTRGEFADLCNSRQLFRAVELGVDVANFAVEFMEKWKGNEYWAVDPYVPTSFFTFDREADFQLAILRLAKFNARARVVRSTGKYFSKFLENRPFYKPPDTQVEFVYIDAEHEYEDVMNDLKEWWPRVSYSGILAGHDFNLQCGGVAKAVTEFFIQEQRNVYLTQEINFPTSWYVYKTPGMYGLEEYHD